MKQRHALWILSPALLGAAGCVAAERSSNYLSPTVAGPIPGVAITTPQPVTPNQGARISVEAQPLTLSVENATTTGVRPLSYAFEIATDLDFGNKVFDRQDVPPGEGGRTSLRLPDRLATGRSYYWRSRAQDGANASEYSFPVIFTIFTPIVIGRPTPLAPSGDISDMSPRFAIQNAPRSGPVGPIIYTIELSANDTFTEKLAIWLAREQPNQTTLQVPTLPGGQRYFWRTQAADPTTSGPWSETRSFRLPAPVIAAPPTGPGRPCGPPYPSDPAGIISCRRSQYGTPMSAGQILALLRGAAKDINAAGVSGGPYGILEKESGHNCGGYSCDIICAGQGTSQRQHDVLSDAEGEAGPMWGSPKRWPNIRVDTCHIQ
jgi:hypothetical protein